MAPTLEYRIREVWLAAAAISTVLIAITALAIPAVAVPAVVAGITPAPSAGAPNARRSDNAAAPVVTRVSAVAESALPGAVAAAHTAVFAPYAAVGTTAAVAADVPACSAAGLTVLREWGGSAADAAVVTVLCQGVLAPYASGLGGGAFILAVAPVDGAARNSSSTSPRVTYYDAREVAPAAATADRYANVTREQISSGGLAVGVPGELAGLAALHANAGRLPWSRLVLAAAEMADAAPVTAELERRLAQQNERGFFAKWPHLAALYTVRDHYGCKEGERRLLRVGDTLRQPELAATLRAIAADGPSALYGDTSIGRAIAAAVADAGGRLTTADLAAYTVVRREPVAVAWSPGAAGPWAGVPLTLFGAPPPSAGGAVVSFLLRLLGDEPPLPPIADDAAACNATADRYAAFIEASQHAFARRSAVGDPAFAPSVKSDVDRLFLAHAAVDGVRPKLGVSRPQPSDAYVPPAARAPSPPADAGTTHVSIVDGAGHAVSITSSVNWNFGSGVVASSAGLVLNNQLADFKLSTDDGDGSAGPNAIAPGARPLSSMSPIILTGPGGGVVAVAGGAGGPRILTSVAQVLLRAITGGEAIADAVAAPRVHHPWSPAEVSMEGVAGVPPEACALEAVPVFEALPPASWAALCVSLAGRGYTIAAGGKSQVQAVVVDHAGGGLTAASDPRKAGAAAAY
ncbi:hypothetical protein MMPV_000625 [Pyropia vietnamensis]